MCICQQSGRQWVPIVGGPVLVLESRKLGGTISPGSTGGLYLCVAQVLAS